MKKFFALTIIFFILFSCEEGEKNVEENTSEVTTEIPADSDSLLSSPDDVVIDPSLPILTDAEILDKTTVDPFDSQAIASLYNKTVADQKDQLRSSLDFSSLTVNYFNPSDFDTSSLIGSRSVGPLKIVDYGPSGLLPIEIRRPTIYVLFNQPMVPMSKLGEPVTQSPMLEINPPVQGKFRWMGTKMLSFEPDDPMHRNRDYSITVKEDSASIYGKKLGRDFRFVFHNEYVEVLSLAFGSLEELHNSPHEVPPSIGSDIFLTFNQTIEADSLDGYIRVSDDFREYPVKVSSVEAKDNDWNPDTLNRMVHVEVDGEFPYNSEIRVTLLEGARANGNSSPREDAQEASFRTISPFSYVGHSRYSYRFPANPKGVTNPVYLEFSHALDKESVDENISTSFTDVDLTGLVEVYDRMIRISGLPVEYESQYAISLANGISDIYGRSLTTGETVLVEVPKAAEYSRFPGSDGLRSLEAQFGPRLIYEYQNITEGTFFINGESQDPGFATAERNRANYKLVDLTPYLNNGFGTVNVKWDFVENYRNWKNEAKTRHNDRDMNVQVTDLAISTRYSYNKFLIWVNHLSTGEPASGASVTLSGRYGKFRTVEADEEGFAQIQLNSGDLLKYFYKDRNRSHDYEIDITAELGDDRVDLPVRNSQSGWRFGISSSSPIYGDSTYPRVFMFSDRGLYKPGETVTFRGMDWNQHLGEFSPYIGSYQITVQKVDGYRTTDLTSWTGRTTESGGFFETYEISPEMDPVNLRFVYERGGERFSEDVKVAYFRRLSFQAQLKTPDRIYYSGDKISVPVEATYLSGGALAGGGLSSYWTRKPVRYKPPGEKWRFELFGPSVGWLRENVLSSEEATLSVSGKSTLSVTSGDHSILGMAYRYIVEATVEDLDRQTVSVADSVIVHPASYYIGARIADGRAGRWRRFVPVDQQLNLSFSQVDIDGELYDYENEAKVEVFKGTWKAIQQNSIGGRINTRYEWVEELVFETEAQFRNGKASLLYTPEKSGSHRVRISSYDRQDREVITDLGFYVSGGSWARWAGQNSDDITLEVEQDLYFPGDTARILVKSPLEKGRYLLTIEREGILEERIVEIGPENPFIELEVQEEWVPVMYVTLSSYMNRTDQPESYFDPDFGKPKGIFGAAPINISTESRELDVQVMSDKAVYRPGEKALVTVSVSYNGIPAANTEITYLAVDRGVLDLINYHIPNPLSYFYSPYHFRMHGTGDESRRLLLAPVTYDVTNLVGGDGEDGKLKRREDFTPLAVFEPFLKTDENGEVTIEVDWPDTLTTYRSTVIALKGDKIGYLEDELYVKNPVNVRAALPRRMRVRDTGFAGVIITNIDNVDHEVTIRAESSLIGLPGENEKTVSVPAGRSFEVPFVLEAKESGTGEIVFTVLSDVLREQLVKTITVEQPLIKESFTTTGIVGRDSELGEELLIIPQSIGQSYGSFSFSIDSSQAPFLRDQLNQFSSLRIYGNTYDYLYRALPGILAPEVTKEMGDSFRRGAESDLKVFLKILNSRQRGDGGIATSDHMIQYGSNPFLSLVSMHMLQVLSQFDSEYARVVRVDKLFSYLRKYASEHQTDLYFNLYLHYVQTLAGLKNPDKTDEFLAMEDELGISGYALMAYCSELEGRSREMEKIYKKLKNFVSMGTRGVDIRETYEARFYFDSMYQQLSHILKLAIKSEEEPEIIQRYTYSLNTERNHRNWMNNHDRLWMTSALGDLVHSEKPQDTYFEAEVLLGEKTLTEKRFEGFSRGPEEKNYSLFDDIVPLAGIGEASSLQFRKTGNGNLYYSSTLKYALPNEVATMRDEGLSIFTQIESLEGEVVENNELELGETYRMKVLLNTVKNRSFVNLSVPIPSGAEIVDPTFVTTSRYANAGGANGESWTRESEYGDEQSYIGEGYIIDGYFYPFTPSQLVFDNEVRYSWDSLYYGQREISFLFRCTTPGIYPTPPASAELLFEPEVFGRGRGRLIVIH